MKADIKPIDRAFQKLRRHGYFARQNFLCCQTCGVAAVPDKNVSKYVFYHGQDFDSLKETGQCFLCWDGDAKFICETLKEVGLKVDHDGSPGSRIMISMPNSVMN